MMIIQMEKTSDNIESFNKILKILNHQLMLENLNEESINKIKNEILIYMDKININMDSIILNNIGETGIKNQIKNKINIQKDIKELTLLAYPWRNHYNLQSHNII